MSAAGPWNVSAFDRRLDRTSRAPLAVAFSGGGDSLALLLAAKAWGDQAGRPILALTVDHGLQASSAEWTERAAAVAARVGVRFQPLIWRGPKPLTGQPAAARAARHRLIAQAARAAGASVILVGHTLDDQLENALMRASGAPVGTLHAWSPSPVWPQGHGLFHFRPLLTERRADLRDRLAERRWDWIEDPANDDPCHPRARARASLADRAVAPPPTPSGRGGLSDLAAACIAEPWGGFTLERDRLRGADPACALRWLQIAIACASGQESLARPGRARSMLARLRSDEAFEATLGGARVAADRRILIAREAGEASRGGLPALALAAGRPMVWDGRVELTARVAGLSVRRLAGLAARLPAQARSGLSTVPASARGALAAIVDETGGVTCPSLASERKSVRLRSLTGPRMAAASGLIDREQTIVTKASIAKLDSPSYVGVEC